MTTANTTSDVLARWFTGDDGTDITRVTKPYAQSGTVFACIDAILRSCQSIQMMLSTADESIVETGPAYDFLFNNKDMPFSYLLNYTIGNYALDRFVYWIFPDKIVGEPDRIIVANKRHCKPVINNGVVVGYYLYMPGGKRLPLLFDEVYPIYGFNPYNEIGIPSAIGPTDAGAASIGSSAMASMYSESLFANGARPGGIIHHPGKPDPDEIVRLRGDFESRHKGVRAAGKTAMLTGGATYENVASTFAELDMTNFSGLKHKEICSVMGTPLEVINMGTEAQYSNGPAQQRFIINTIIPFLNLFAEHINTAVLPRFRSTVKSVTLDKSCSFIGRKSLALHKRLSFKSAKFKAINNVKQVFAWFNSDDHPTIKSMMIEIAQSSLKQTEYGIPLNEIIDAYDLPYNHQPWGDTGFMNAGKMPVSFLLEPTAPAEPQPTPDEGKAVGNAAPGVPQEHDSTATGMERAKAISTAKLASIRRTVLASRRSHEKGYQNALRAFFVRQQGSITTKLKSVFKQLEEKSVDIDKNKSTLSETQLKTRIKTDVRGIMQFIFDIKEENGKLIAINKTFFYPAAETGASVLYEELAADTAKLPDYKNSKIVKQAIKEQTLNITSVNETTRKAIQTTLEDAIENGSSYKDVVSALKDKFNMRLNSAKITAQLQITGATEAGRNAGMESAGVKKKAWGTAGDSGVRSSHAQAAVDYREGIPIDQPFIVGGSSMMYPGDPSGDISQTAGCRCYTVPIVG